MSVGGTDTAAGVYTIEELTTLLDACGWSARQLAASCGYSESMGAHWIAGRAAVPAEVLTWLRQVADLLRDHPPPARYDE